MAKAAVQSEPPGTQIFEPDCEATQKAWEKAVDVQMHFNSMMAQTRRIAVVVALALYAAATSDAIDDTAVLMFWGFDLPFSTLALAGILFSGFALAADRSYYHRLLMASVRFAERLERDRPEELGLSAALSREVTQGHAHLMAFTLYGGLILVGVIVLRL